MFFLVHVQLDQLLTTFRSLEFKEDLLSKMHILYVLFFHLLLKIVRVLLKNPPSCFLAIS